MPQRHTTGFTLLEILLVVAIIAITATIIAPNIHRDTDRLANNEARRFQALVLLARDEAILRGQLFALEVDEMDGSYQFLKRVKDQKWKPVTSVDALHRRKLAKGVYMILTSGPAGQAKKNKLLLIRPTGQIDRFTLTIGGEKQKFRLLLNQNQALQLVAEPTSK